MTTITLNLYHIGKYYKVQINIEQKISELAVAASKQIDLQPENMIMLIEKRFAALEHYATLQEYDLHDGDIVIVMGSNVVAADPAQEYTDAQLRRIMLEQESLQYPVGIDNQSQFCYLISSIQALYALEPIREAVINANVESNSYLAALQDIFKALASFSDKIDIQPFARVFSQHNPDFSDFTKQYDAQEALQLIEQQLIADLFNGQSPFQFYMNKGDKDDFVRVNVSKQVETLSQDFDAKRTEGIMYKSGPRFLQIQFLRFSVDANTQKVNKITKRITFGNQFILDKYMEGQGDDKKEKIYDLVSIIAHQGQETTKGHYVCYAKHKDVWYLFNDNYVGKVDQQKLNEVQGGQSNTAISYVLLYQLRGN